MTGGIMIAAAAYLWKRWRKKEAVKTAVTLFALVALYPSWPADQWRKSGWDTSPPCCCPRRFRPACSSTTHTKCQLVSGMSPTTFPKASRCALYYSRTAFSRASRCVFYYSRTVFSRASRRALYYSRTAFRRASRCVFYYSRTVFPRASRCVFYYSRFAAGGFLAASLVMEPSCSALMAASPPGPADAQIGLIGTASQQPA